jgi:hypothetical protein
MLRDVVTTITPLVEQNTNTLAVHHAADLGAMRADLTKVRREPIAARPCWQRCATWWQRVLAGQKRLRRRL